jgi:hypothetical protein
MMATLQDISAIKNCNRPTLKKEIFSYLCLASYEPKYVPNFATYKKVLRNLVIGDAKHITWNVSANEPFESLKYKIGKQSVLAHFIKSCETEIFCVAF